MARYAGECLSNARSVQYTRYHCRGMFDAMVVAGVYWTRDYNRWVEVTPRTLRNLKFWGGVRSNSAICLKEGNLLTMPHHNLMSQEIAKMRLVL